MSIFHVHPNIAKAKTIATSIYTSQEYFELAKEKIFAPSWQFIGSKELVKFSGDVQPNPAAGLHERTFNAYQRQG